MCNNFCWMKKTRKVVFTDHTFWTQVLLFAWKNGLHKFQLPDVWSFANAYLSAPCLILLYCLGNSIPFKPASFITWSAILKHTWVFWDAKKKDIVKIQGSVTSHPNYAAKILVSESVYWKFPQAKGGEVLCRNLHTQRKIQGAISWTSS